MGIDYMYSGSRSYPGFDEEVTEIVKIIRRRNHRSL